MDELFTPPATIEEFIDLVLPTIRAAERHLNVAEGTLADIRHDNDFLAIVKIHATIEPLLGEALRTTVTRALTHPKVSFPGGEAVAKLILNARLEEKIRIGLSNEILTQDHAAFARAIMRLRNHYAHNVAHMSQRLDEAAAIIDKQTEGFNIQRDLLSSSRNLKRGPTGLVVLAALRPLLFVRFASMLAALLEGIKPPDVVGIMSALSRSPVGELKATEE